jgi:DNA-binding response OmpR family regulator
VIARILLADDDDMCRRALGNLLSRAGFDVVTVDDGAPAIAMSETKLFDIVLADLNMKTVGGIEVIKHFKHKYGIGVCCVVLSGEDDETMNAECYSAGADDVIRKPTTPAELRRRLISAALALRGNAA